ncbi:MAG: NAD-dependent epimerase/dehydratase family protein [Pirellulales bacterium]|nr:NAD-dependent epimerase/dehydratase family protein [Pirellulales bacterium]
MATKTALVTGASGFIGPHLVRVLQREGRHVRCLVRKTSQTASLVELGAELVTGDVTEAPSLAAAVEGVDEIYHLAGVTKSFRPEGFQAVNETGTRNLAVAAAEQPQPPVLVHVSSLAAAGAAPVGRDRTETDPASPVSTYGRSKRAGEIIAESYAERVPTTIVRPPIVFGEGDRDMLQMFVPIRWTGVHFVPSLAKRYVSLVYAGDLAEGLLLAAERGKRLATQPQIAGQGYYFIAFDDQPSYAELGRLCGIALGRRWTFAAPTPEIFSWGLAGVNELAARVRRRPGIVNFDKIREASAGSWICSVAKAREELGFRPSATLAERLEQTVRWWRAQRWL